MNTSVINDYILRGYEFTISIIDQGPNEGWFKASLEKGLDIIEEVGETPGEALKNLRKRFGITI